jgi:hypothetical protein
MGRMNARILVAACALAPIGVRMQSTGAPEWKPDDAVVQALSRIRESDIETDLRALVAAGTRHSASEDFDRTPEHDGKSRGIGVARRYLLQQLRAISKATGGRLEVREDWVELKSERRLPQGSARGANVIARLPGTSDPRRTVVISGHYDSINRRYDKLRGGIDITGDAPGADDDGSGTVAVLAAARALAGLKFAATIEFACYTAEEQGLLGSAAHARQLREAGAEVIAMATNDIVGASRGPDGVVRNDFVRLFSTAAGIDSPSRNLARHACDIARLYFGQSPEPFNAKLIFRTDRYGRGGDHTSFENEGFPAIRFTEPMEDYNHQHEDVRDEKGIAFGDRIDFVDFNYIARVARLNAAFAAELAGSPPAPAKVRVQGALRNDTAVLWDDAAHGSAAAYEVVVRETTAPCWERAIGVAGGKATIPVTLDNHVIGLRSIGENGRRSPAFVPPDPADSRRAPSSVPARQGSAR